ncbi:MAG: AzlD domain-containing protein [Chloroflexi bacterium]|nr:AzlD domain-containing protein [Chloroflexota bacterium]
MSLWLVILLAGLLTFGTRLSFILLLDRIKVPGWFRRGLRFVPAAVLSAIILPELATRNAVLDLSLQNPQLYAGALAVLVAWRTKNVLLTIIVGMAALLIFQAFLGMV